MEVDSYLYTLIDLITHDIINDKHGNFVFMYYYYCPYYWDEFTYHKNHQVKAYSSEVSMLQL